VKRGGRERRLPADQVWADGLFKVVIWPDSRQNGDERGMDFKVEHFRKTQEQYEQGWRQVDD
jgi:hypothetical protein